MTRTRSPMPPAVLAAVLVLATAACGADQASSDPSEPAAPSATEQPSEAAEPSETPEPSEAPEPSETPEPSEAAEPSEPSEPTVRMAAFAFDTAVLRVAPGTTVRFENADSAQHTVTHGTDGVRANDPIVDAQVGPGGARNVTFDEPGTYPITCRLHPSMNMTVIVEG